MTKRKAKIFYVAMDDFWRKEEKLAWLRENPISKIAFETITPDEKHNWIFDENDFDSLLPLVSKDAKSGKNETAIFQLYSLGVSTNRDSWITDLSPKHLQEKMKFFISEYDKSTSPEENSSIKWSSTLSTRFTQQRKEKFDHKRIRPILYRPFFKQNLYYSDLYIDRPAYSKELFLRDNKSILCCYGERLDFSAVATNIIPSLNFFSLEVAQAISLYRYDSEGNHYDNITDWAVEEFARRGARGLSKGDIFHYVYAVLHYPPYRQKYEQNLKREFPRIPVYKNALEWAKLGRQLMELHLNYETVEAYALVQKEIEPLSGRNASVNERASDAETGTLPNGRVSARNERADVFVPKPTTRLRADKENGIIEIDTFTRLEGVPAIAWEYKLGNRSALEWILDQYKERKPKDPTIAEKFNTYKFEDYKEHVIDLLKHVCTVSVRTMEIINSMPENDNDSR